MVIHSQDTLATIWHDWHRHRAITTSGGNTPNASSVIVQPPFDVREAAREISRRMHNRITGGENPSDLMARLGVARREERAAANLRAERLLKSALTQSQKDELDAKGYFTLRKFDANGVRFYRIRRGRSRNIERVTEEGIVIRTLCAHPIEGVPDGDTMLTQKLWLESCEEEFLRVANHS